MKISRFFKQFYVKSLSKAKYIEYLRKLGVRIGKGCDIDKTANFGSEPWLIKLGDNVRITRGVQFITHDGALWTLRKMGLIDGQSVKYGPIKIGDNCNISWNSIILPNITIGKNSIVAAGAVVTHNVPEGSIVGGVPARVIESVDEYYEKIKNDCVPAFSMSNAQKREYLEKIKPEWFE